MEIELRIHVDVLDDPHVAFSWWAESPDLPGFTAAGASLVEMNKPSPSKS